MDACKTVSVLSYRESRPLGKVRRRLQDLRNPSSSVYDFIASGPTFDLSHNESARLAVDCLLSQGLEGYHKMLKAEGEVDFLSEQEKNYILENVKDFNTDDSDVPINDDEKELESLSVGSQSPTQCQAASTDSDPTVAEVAQSSLKDLKLSDPVQDDPSTEVYFQSDSRAACMKDLLRQFIRRAKQALAIVMDSFSDVELLFDLLEASKKRNVSVHLLLDHLNLNMFVSMWQDLKLNSNNFPNLSVRSVHGQTYCAKTGRKLTGQITESFIITDWTEVLTGSYSFSWLSWQVHRSLAVHIKGSSATPFQQEFQRLHTSSKPVAGFVTFIPLPHTLCSTSHATMDDITGGGKEKSNHKEGSAALQMQGKPPQPYPVWLQPVTSVEKYTVGPVRTMHDARTNVELLEKNPNHTRSHLTPLNQTHFSNVQHEIAGLTIAENSVWFQDPNSPHTPSLQRTVLTQSPLMRTSHLDQPDVGTTQLFFQQRNRNMLTQPAGLNALQRQWKCSLNFNSKVDLPSENLKLLSHTLQQSQEKAILQFPFTHLRGHNSGRQTSLETRRQDQPPLQPRTLLSSQLQRDSMLFLPGAKEQLQMNPPPGLKWTPQNHPNAAQPRMLARHSSFITNHGIGQTTRTQLGWRPFQSGMNARLERSKSMTERRAAGFSSNRNQT
ncbi:uncharacterized protein LOC114448345 [Parambassis ranga]|uniref:Uncharacterized protein LOC114448345 n=1 Tax=Parambassis ranga TaxID=210632 RepID=A0A6P7JZT4_9TELE|nr:protein FAM83A [Parambassis ranga]